MSQMPSEYEKARRILVFADCFDREEVPVSPQQKRDGIKALIRLVVQAVMTEKLVAPILSENGDVRLNNPMEEIAQLRLGKAVPESPTTHEARLSDGLFIASPWSKSRYRRSLMRTLPSWRKREWEPQEDQTSILYLPWGITCVDNGNHSAASGYLWGDGVLFPEESRDLSELLALIDIGEEGIIRREDGQVIRSADWTTLALIGLGQRLIELGDIC